MLLKNVDITKSQNKGDMIKMRLIFNNNEGILKVSINDGDDIQ